MDIDNPAPFLGFEIDHGLAELNAGVVDENVDRNALCVEMLEGRQDRALIGDVEGTRADLLPGIRKRFRGVRELRLVAAVENDGGACGGKAARHGKTKPLRGAGDERRLAAKVEQARQITHPPLAMSPYAASSMRTGV